MVERSGLSENVKAFYSISGRKNRLCGREWSMALRNIYVYGNSELYRGLLNTTPLPLKTS